MDKLAAGTRHHSNITRRLSFGADHIGKADAHRVFFFSRYSCAPFFLVRTNTLLVRIRNAEIFFFLIPYAVYIVWRYDHVQTLFRSDVSISA